MMTSSPKKKLVNGSVVLLVSLINPSLLFPWSCSLPLCPSWRQDGVRNPMANSVLMQ